MKIIFDFGLIFVLMQVNLVVKLEPQKMFWSTVIQVETNMPGFFITIIILCSLSIK